ncbi:MAG: fasciclin domain-containing protein [Balneolaceae bacterium]
MKKLIKKNLKLLPFLFLIIATGFFSCSDDNDGGTQVDGQLNIVETALENENFSILAQAIQDAGLTVALEGEGPFTVFAPTNSAFEALPSGTLESLTNEQLVQILQFHVVEGRIASTDLAITQDVATLSGEELLIQFESGTVTINGTSNVTLANVEASNGIIHAINTVLLPQGIREANIVDQAEAAGTFTTLISALESTNLTTTLKYNGDFTVFAPTDDAFNALPTGLLASLTVEQLTEILTYHVLSGEVFSNDLDAQQAPTTLFGEELFVTSGTQGVFVNGSSEVATADIDVTNGVIHAINKVLFPDSYGTVVDAASKRYNFNTLVNAIVSADLVTALSDTEGTFTVFAPTDAAFANLPEGLLASLTTEQLATILQYHVLPVNVASVDLEASQAPASLTGESIYVTLENGIVTVNNNPTVIEADISTNNGTIHAIDEVILPNQFLNIVQIASKNYDLSTLVSLVADANLVTTLEGDGPFTIFAPTNQAFADVQATLDGLTAEQVSEVLQYHVVALEALSNSLSDGQIVPTVQGEEITINIDGEGNVTLNGSVNVVSVDLEGTNGVIHIIDGVLLPPSYLN